MSPYGATQLAESFRTVRKNSIQIAEEIPEDKYDFVPAPGTRTLSQMLVHIAVAPRLWQEVNETSSPETYDRVKAFVDMTAEESKKRSKAEVIELLRSTGERFASFLQGLSDEFLAEQVGHPGPNGSRSRLEGLLSVKEHEMHHRGQLMLAERQLGIVPHLTRVMQERWSQMQAAKK